MNACSNDTAVSTCFVLATRVRVKAINSCRTDFCHCIYADTGLPVCLPLKYIATKLVAHVHYVNGRDTRASHRLHRAAALSRGFD